MGFTKAVEPVLGKESIRPAPITTQSLRVSTVTLHEKASQTCPKMTVNRRKDTRVTMTKIAKPPTKRAIQLLNRTLQ